MVDHKFFRPEGNLSVFHNIRFDDYPTLSDVIKALNWGSNRDIRQKGFRIAPLEPWPGIIKSWPRITDPYHTINVSSLITSKGQSVVVIHAPESVGLENEDNNAS